MSSLYPDGEAVLHVRLDAVEARLKALERSSRLTAVEGDMAKIRDTITDLSGRWLRAINDCRAALDDLRPRVAALEGAAKTAQPEPGDAPSVVGASVWELAPAMTALARCLGWEQVEVSFDRQGTRDCVAIWGVREGAQGTIFVADLIAAWASRPGGAVAITSTHATVQWSPRAGITSSRTLPVFAPYSAKLHTLILLMRDCAIEAGWIAREEATP